MRDTETKPRRMGLKMKILLILLTLLLICGAVLAAFLCGLRQASQAAEPQITGDLLASRLRSVQELVTVSYYYTNMGRFENQVDFYGWKVPFTTKSFIVSYDGVIKAGVDLEKSPSLEVREYIQDMSVLMRAADLVICRAGASTISELTALGQPAIIVPSPNVVHNHQEHNARVLADAGGAEMILEKDCSGELLFKTACAILKDRDRRRRMSVAMASLGSIDAAENIYSAIMALQGRRKK